MQTWTLVRIAKDFDRYWRKTTPVPDSELGLENGAGWVDRSLFFHVIGGAPFEAVLVYDDGQDTEAVWRPTNFNAARDAFTREWAADPELANGDVFGRILDFLETHPDVYIEWAG